MSKKKEDLDSQPFSGFSLIKGEFPTPPSPEDDDVETGDKTIITDDNDDLTDDETKLAKGNEVLEKVIEKQKAALDKSKPLEVEDDEDEEEESDNDDSGIKDFVKALSEKGVIDFDDTDEDFEASEEGIEKLVDKTVKNRIDKWANELPEDFNKLLQFVEAGGDPKQFLDIYYGNHSWENYSIESDEAQKAAVRESLRLAGEDASDIEDIVEDWYESGILKKRAESAIKKLQKHESALKAQLVDEQKAADARKKAEEKAYWDGFKKDIETREEIKGFKLTPKTKDNLWNFMTKVDKSGKTEYQKAIEAEKDSALLFAYFAMNKFDTAKLEKQVESKVSNKYAGMLKNYSKSTKERMSNGSTPNHSDDNPFAAFGAK